MTQDPNDNQDFLESLTPTQEHFLKKYVLENRLAHELHMFNSPEICDLLGPPFKSNKKENGFDTLPLLAFYMNNFITNFPFIANNSAEDQKAFWQDTVQPFLESFNSKNISSSEERQEHVTKRRQVNKKLLSGLLLFYNSVVITDKELTYLNESHYQPSDTGKMDKFTNHLTEETLCIDDMERHELKKYYNDLSLNIVAVRRLSPTEPHFEPPASSWNPLRYVMAAKPKGPRHHYEFVIQATTRTENEKNGYSYESHFIPRHYHEFKSLEHDLKKALPGLMSTEVSSLPHKVSDDIGYAASDDQSEDSSLASSVAPIKVNKLEREKLRLSLRGYLRALSKYPEIVHSKIFQNFVDNKSLNYDNLSLEERLDHEVRIEHETNMLKTQLEFQNQTSKVIVQLSKDFEELKKKLIMNPKTVTEIFEQIGQSPDIKKQSSFLKTLNEWCKLEASATLYQMFLGQDNSNDWLNRCRKFHRLFPYNVVYGILKFTNPVKIVSRVIDLLLVNIPTLSLPTWRSSEEDEELKQATKKAGSRNLLSIIFIMLLDESLSNYEKELQQLRDVKLDPGFEIFLEKIESYTTQSYETVADIKHESLEKSQDLLLTILSSDLIKPKLATTEEHFKYQKILKSFRAYEQINEDKNLKEAELYLNLKQFWQIEVRKKDAALFKQLWQEPELTKLIKNFLTIFYQPMMKIFAKADVHVVFKDFQRFMDDLIGELISINNREIYYLNSFEIFDRLKSLFDRHDAVLWKFIHQMYVKDDEEIFKKLVLWIERFLIALRLKFVDEKSVKLTLSSINKDIDKDLFLLQLNSRADKIIQRRKFFKEYLSRKALVEDHTAQAKIDNRWEEVNNELYGDFNTQGFGVDYDDIEEFNNLNAEDDLTDDSHERQLKQRLYDLENSDNYGTSELDKLDDSVKIQLTNMFKKLQL
ncbi:uncharacterized protein RJT20DRAFT_26122 [Scheffersomyces xylosifermentans]|uniref:uncharacterized protein n=1 Tax=Scheffersomyces xylosifermentans TaxID=1304137 RepID=UPI00315C970A